MNSSMRMMRLNTWMLGEWRLPDHGDVHTLWTDLVEGGVEGVLDEGIEEEVQEDEEDHAVDLALHEAHIDPDDPDLPVHYSNYPLARVETRWKGGDWIDTHTDYSIQTVDLREDMRLSTNRRILAC